MWGDIVASAILGFVMSAWCAFHLLGYKGQRRIGVSAEYSSVLAFFGHEKMDSNSQPDDLFQRPLSLDKGKPSPGQSNRFTELERSHRAYLRVNLLCQAVLSQSSGGNVRHQSVQCQNLFDTSESSRSPCRTVFRIGHIVSQVFQRCCMLAKRGKAYV